MNRLFMVLGFIILMGACGKEKKEIFDDTIEANIEEINIVLDKIEITAREGVRFDIAGKADFLTFFSGELGKEYYENSFGGAEYDGKIDYLEYVYSEAGEYEAVFLLEDKAGNKRTIGPFHITVNAAPEPEPEPEPMLVEGTVNGNISGTDFAFDLAGMASYSPGVITSTNNSPGTAHDPGVPEKIDMVMLWLGNAPTFSLPTGVTNSSSSGVFNLSTKNDGILFRLENPTPDEVARFDDMETRDELIAAFDLEYSTLESRSVYVKSIYSLDPPENTTTVNNHGPITGGPWPSGTTARMRGANVGDILYFKSLGRNLYAAFRVKTIQTANTPRTIELEVKSILVVD